MDNDLSPAEVFAPGEFIRDELEARGWTQDDLAKILSRPAKTVNQIITGKKQITPDTAVELAQAFDTSPELWLRLESTYRLSLAPKEKEPIAKRSRLYSLAPVKELWKRKWIQSDPKGDVYALEKEICDFFSISSVDETPDIPFAARVSDKGSSNVSSQMAWACRVKKLASEMHTSPYSSRKLREALPTLPQYSPNKKAVTELPEVLSRLGVRLVFVPHLLQTRIDGAALWLNRTTPVVSLSLRYNRIDSFWFTLMHELAHIVRGHRKDLAIIDNRLVGNDRQAPDVKNEEEKEADALASEWLIPAKAMAKFVRETKPYFSRQRIECFANELGIHPGIVEGRLQFERRVPYSHLRVLLENVKGVIRADGLLDAVTA